MSRNNYEPIVVCSTEGMTEQEWLEWRKKGIGGSDAGVCMGANHYRTKRDLYFDKIGKKPVVEKEKSDLPLRWGHALEPVVAEEFSIRMGLPVYERKEMYRHPDYPFMQANVDRFITLPDGTVGILECKTANPAVKQQWEDNSIPFSYEIQVRHYMAVMNIDTAYIACLFENSSDTMVIRKIERDQEFEAQLIEAEKNFWENYVLKGIEPPFEEEPDLCFETIDRNVQVQIGQSIELTGFDDVLPQIAALKAEKKRLEDEAKAAAKKADALMVQIVDAMGNKNACSATVDGIKYTIKRTPMKPRTGVPSELLVRMKDLHPDIYGEFVKETPVKSRIDFKYGPAD